MAKQNVLILGATGSTGSSIVNGLLESGNFVSVGLGYTFPPGLPYSRKLDGYSGDASLFCIKAHGRSFKEPRC